jgi:hypothetical protein
MKLEHVFTRTDATIGLDAVPTDAAYLLLDNVFHAPQYGPHTEPLESIALAYNGPALAPDATVNLYLWDAQTEEWYLFASAHLLPAGEVHFIPLPNIIDRKDSRATNRIDVAIVVSLEDKPPAGDYEFAASSATAGAGGGGGGGGAIDEPISVEGTTLEGAAPLTLPLDIAVTRDADPGPYADGLLYRLRLDSQGRVIVSAQGSDVDGAALTRNPVPVGGKFISDPTSSPLDDGDVGVALLNLLRMLVVEPRAIVEDADPAPLAPGVYRHLRLDSEGRLIVTDPSASPLIQGIDADDDPATANPVLIGGKYISDPYADTLDDGDAGYALLNLLRMLIVEDRTYDAPTDSNKVVPVSDPTGKWEPATLDSSLTADGSVTKYVDMRGFLRWALLLQMTKGAAETITLTVAQSHDDVDDPTTAVFEDVTFPFFGTTGFSANSYIGPENQVACTWLRIIVTVTGYTAGTSSWVLRGIKTAQA